LRHSGFGLLADFKDWDFGLGHSSGLFLLQVFYLSLGFIRPVLFGLLMQAPGLLQPLDLLVHRLYLPLEGYTSFAQSLEFHKWICSLI